MDYSEGVLHLVYAVHGSEADFLRIETDLQLVPTKNRRLILVFEDVLTVEYVCERLDPSLRHLPPEVLFDPNTVRRNRERLAIAYAAAVDEMNRMYQAWNALPAVDRHRIFGATSPFNRRLLAWAADHEVELVREETSLEAWLTLTGWQTYSRRTDAAMARGIPARMWEEHRNEWEALARTVRLRDVDVNAQITRILNVDRRGHDVLYVVGVLHAVNEDVLVANCNAVVHRRRFAEAVSERLVKALMNGTFDHQPAESREDLQALVFLHDRLLRIARPARLDELGLLLTKIFQATAERHVTLRQVIDYLVTLREFQEKARSLDATSQRRYAASAFITMMVNAGLIALPEAEEHLYL